MIMFKFNQLIRIFNLKQFTLFLFIALFIISGAIDLLSIALIGPFIVLLIDKDNEQVGKFIEQYLNFENFSQADIMVFLISALVGVFILKCIISIFIRFWVVKFSLQCRAKLQSSLLDIYQSMEYENFNLRNDTDFIKNLRELTGDCANYLDAYLRMMSESIVLILLISYLFITHTIALSLFLIFILLIFFFYNNLLKPKTIKYGERKLKGLEFIYEAVDGAIKGFKEIRILKKENYFKDTLKKGLDEVFINDLKTFVIYFLPRYLYELFIVVFIILFIFFSLASNQVVDFLPTVAIFAFVGARLIPGISSISNSLVVINYGKFTLDTIDKDIGYKNKNYRDKKNVDLKQKNINKIELKNIKFKYQNNDNYVFDNLNLIIEKKDCIGIVGQNGSGKTTLVDILLGLLKPNSGKIYVNDEQVNHIDYFHSKTGYIPQNHLIISDRIINNITLEEKNESIDKGKLKDSLSKVNLSEAIESLKMGVNTKIGKDGIKLSGGQFKKIALARMFYHNKEILILDEATSSLDKKSENMVMEELEKIKEHKTMIIISHNLKILNICDKIFKIENKSLKKL